MPYTARADVPVGRLRSLASVPAFMLALGIHVTVMWAMRSEPDPERSMTFFNDLPNATGLRILLALVVVPGATAGLMGSWWGSGWIWASLLLLVVIAVAMWRFGSGYFGRLIKPPCPPSRPATSIRGIPALKLVSTRPGAAGTRSVCPSSGSAAWRLSCG